MFEDIAKIIIPLIICLLIIWLIYRIKRGLRLTIKNEIYNNFPNIKNTVDNFEHRVDYLKIQTEVLEQKLKELESKLKDKGIP